jgi:hypothetical protein
MLMGKAQEQEMLRRVSGRHRLPCTTGVRRVPLAVEVAAVDRAVKARQRAREHGPSFWDALPVTIAGTRPSTPMYTGFVIRCRVVECDHLMARPIAENDSPTTRRRNTSRIRSASLLPRSRALRAAAAQRRPISSRCASCIRLMYSLGNFK